jgi:hypothetical protein
LEGSLKGLYIYGTPIELIDFLKDDVKSSVTGPGAVSTAQTNFACATGIQAMPEALKSAAYGFEVPEKII